MPPCLPSLLPVGDLHSLALQSGLIQRRSPKFSAEGFLLSLLQSVARGDSSFNQLAQCLGSHEAVPLTRQAMSLRFSEASCDFLIAVVCRLLSQHAAPKVDHRWRHLFSRILIEDSTVLPMHKRNAPDFPGNGNGRGSTAGCKVQWTFDLLSGRTLDVDLQSARTPDQLQSETLPSSLIPGDLVLRDMGYFVIDSLQRIEDQAYPSGVSPSGPRS